ncbi:MAG TPA: PHP domain-containing protein [Chthoniobacteraceae bacterium]|nr:PHP domain-containing protein [Chthoniobacteraceae bacterium]
MKNTPALYDLHLHTYWSYDALADPEVHFRRARELGLRCLAITEHHNLDALPDLVRIAADYPDIRWIVAAELTVNTSIGAVDLLCYGLPLQPCGLLAQVLDEYHEWQRAAGAARVRQMQALGFDYSSEEHLALLRSYRPERTLERQGATHVRGKTEIDYFIRRGFIANPGERAALLQRLPKELATPCYPSVERVVPAVKQAGGLVVIAHPAGYFQDRNRQRMDALREECGLDGIECAHRSVHPEQTAFYRAYCREHGLLSTGGSDSHDNEDVLTPPEQWGHTREKRFACHLGEEAWLDEFLERLP